MEVIMLDDDVLAEDCFGCLGKTGAHIKDYCPGIDS
jgi:hypothetical protein